MAILKENPTLPEFQHYIKEICKERGWDKNTDLEIFLLFTEEVGELAKAIRKSQGLYNEKAKNTKHNLEEEFADVFSYLLDLANYFNVDLEKAFRLKDKLNSSRKWD
ncbi:MAG: RS21-C6 protein [Acidobacteria bacterium]|nr:RS21-C6 protein [Acidobacteriota bacterium]